MKLFLSAAALAFMALPLVLPSDPRSAPPPAPKPPGRILMVVKPEPLPPFDFYSEVVGENSEVPNPHLTFNPNPPKADENLTIEIEWGFYTGDEIKILVDFDPVGSDIEVMVKKPGSAVIAIPKGATKVTASDKSGQANSTTGAVTQ